jgi:hypothetical protein
VIWLVMRHQPESLAEACLSDLGWFIKGVKRLSSATEQVVLWCAPGGWPDCQWHMHCCRQFDMFCNTCVQHGRLAYNHRQLIMSMSSCRRLQTIASKQFSLPATAVAIKNTSLRAGNLPARCIMSSGSHLQLPSTAHAADPSRSGAQKHNGK